MTLHEFLVSRSVTMSHEDESDLGMIIAKAFEKKHNGLKPRKIRNGQMTLCDYSEEFLEEAYPGTVKIPVFESSTSQSNNPSNSVSLKTYRLPRAKNQKARH